jgi:nicotinamidase-related amidase
MSSMIALTLQSRREEPHGSGRFVKTVFKTSWDCRTTAAIVCDMWDRHWCVAANARVAEMAPRMNDVLGILRRRGVLILHAPSGTMEFYADHPGRRLAMEARVEAPARAVPAERPAEPSLPIDDSDGGCPDEPPCAQGRPWKKQIAALTIEEGDAIDDSPQVLRLLDSRGIRNVFLMGVHANMCVLGRPFGIRQLVRHGFQVALVRDLTDTMYNPRKPPYVDHFTGTDLVVGHIEKHWCPTMTSDQLLSDDTAANTASGTAANTASGGAAPFRFAADLRAP